MAKTDWQMNDTVLPEDMNQIGQEINEAEQAAQEAQDTLEDHKTAAVLDHPDGSVSTAKLADSAVTAAKLANNAVTDVKIGNRTITDTSEPSGDSGTLANLLSWLGNMIKRITGKADWRTAPAITLEEAKSEIDELKEDLEEGQTIPAPISRGVNVIQSDQASGATFSVKGRTLCNLLGQNGNCESLAPWTTIGAVELSTVQKRSGTSSIKISPVVGSSSRIRQAINYKLNATKHYVCGCWVYIESYTTGNVSMLIEQYSTTSADYSAQANTSIIGNWQFIYRKIPTDNVISSTEGFAVRFGTTVSNAEWIAYVDEFRFYEVSATDYTAIGTTITGEAIDRYLPYVDSVQPLRGVSVMMPGKNLLPPATQATSIHAAWTIEGPYKATQVRTGSNQQMQFQPRLKTGEQYTLDFIGDQQTNVQSYNASGTNTTLLGVSSAKPRTFTVPMDSVYVLVGFGHGSNGTYTLENWMLVLGGADQLPSSFEPYAPHYAHAPISLYSNIDRTIADSYDSSTGQVFRRWASANITAPISSVTTGTNDLYQVFSTLPFSTADVSKLILADANGYLLQSTVYVDRDLPDSIGKFYLAGSIPNTQLWIIVAKGQTPNYPLALHYVRTTPITEQLSGDLGGLSVVNGGNTVELLEGVVVREKVRQPRLDGTHYYITGKDATSYWGNSRLSHNALQFLTVYRDGEKDLKWTSITGTFLSMRIPAADYDPNAEYHVDYIVLDKYAYTVNAVDATFSYRSTLGGAVAQAAQDIAALKRHEGVQDWALDYIEAKTDNNAFDIAAATPAAMAESLMRRDANGRTKVAAPAAMDDATQLANLYRPPFAQTTGAATAYVVAFSPAITEYVPGLRITVSFHLANGVNPTINVNGLGAKDIICSSTTAPPAGFIRIWSIHTLVYNGSAFQLSGEGGEYGDATAADVLAGKTFGTESGIVTGTMLARGAYELAVNTAVNEDVGKLYIRIPRGAYLDNSGSGYPEIIADDPDFIASNIRSGVNIFGLAGSFEGKRSESGSAMVDYHSPDSHKIFVTGLSFTPSTVIAFLEDNYVPAVIRQWPGYSLVNICWSYDTNNFLLLESMGNGPNQFLVFEGAFQICVLNASGSIGTPNCYWVAFE